MHTISKTNYVSGCQCLKRIWLTAHKPEEGAATDSAHTEEGEEVGALARLYFPNAVTVPLNRAPVMAAQTQQLLKGGHKAICEATFMANGLSCSADIVLVNSDGTLDLVEVKSSTHVKDIQEVDVAFQCYVISNAGYTINNVFLMHINGDYVRHGDIDVHQFFKLENMRAQVNRLTSGVEEKINLFKNVVSSVEEPNVDIGYHCEKPYECPFKEYCFKACGIPEKSVFSISGLNAKKKYELYHSGLITPQQLYGARWMLTERQQGQVCDLLADTGHDDLAEISVNKDAVLSFLEKIRYPLYHLDFETFQRAIPLFEGVKPYAQVPFQYSLHVMDDEHTVSAHREHLADAGTDPRRLLAERLCNDIPWGVQTIAYNYSFEKSVCKALANAFPDLAPHLMDIVNNMIDLMEPFQKKWVTSPAMHGSYSIKAVLPALCGRDPEIDYHMLPVVHNGAEAMATYANLHLVEDQAEVARIRKGLLLYCGLDTMAMVKVLQALYGLVE